MADCRAEVDQEIEGGHCDDTEEERLHGQVQWLVLTDSIQTLDDALDHIDNDLKAMGSVSQVKLGDLTVKNRKTLEQTIDHIRSQWLSKCRELSQLKLVVEKNGDEEIALKSEKQYLEKMVVRLQEQFTETVDSYLAEVQELNISNTEMSQKVQSLESKLELEEKRIRWIVQDNIEGLRKVVEAASKKGTELNDILSLSQEEIRKLERSATLDDMFHVETDEPNSVLNNNNKETIASLHERKVQALMCDNTDSRYLIDQLRHHIHHLEQEKEEMIRKDSSCNEEDGDRYFIDHALKSISATLNSFDFSDILDFSACRKQVLGMKKSSQKLRCDLTNVYKSVLSKEDELCDLRDNIDEIKLKWKNSCTRMESIEDENGYLRRKLDQEESRSKISSDEIISLQNRLQMADCEKKSLMDQIHDLREGKEDLKKYSSNLTKENEKFMQEISRLQSERDHLLEKLQDTTKRASESAQESLDFEEKHESLEKAFSKLRREFQEQNRELLAMNRENDELKLILQEHQGEREKYRNEFRNIDIVNKDLEDQVFQLSNENERLLSELEKTRRAKQQGDSSLRDTKLLLEKKEASETHFEQKIKELNRTLKDTVEKYNTSQVGMQERSSELAKASDRLSDIDLFLRQLLRQRKELLFTVCGDKDNNIVQKLAVFAGTSFELDGIASIQEKELPAVLENSFETLLRSIRSLQKDQEETEENRLKLAQVLKRFLNSTFNSKNENPGENSSPLTQEECPNMSNIVVNVKEITSYCEKLENDIENLKRVSVEMNKENTGESLCTGESQPKPFRKVSLSEQKERTLMLKLKNKKNVETALRGKISRLRKEVKEMKNQTASVRCTSADSHLPEDISKRSIDELSEWREFMKGIVEEFSTVKERTEQCMAEDLIPLDETNDQENYLKKRSKSIALQIQTLLRNTKEALTQKEKEIEEQLEGKKVLQEKLEDTKCQFEALNKDREACLYENSKLKQLRDMIVKYTVAATRQLDVIMENLSGKECVIMFQRKPGHINNSPGEVDSTGELITFVRETLRANEQTLQASIATLEMVKAKGLCEFVPDEDLFLVDAEQREMLKILRRMNQSVDAVTKRLRTLMIGAEYVRAGSVHDLRSVADDQNKGLDKYTGTRSSMNELQESLNQKEELLKILENELEQLRSEKTALIDGIQDRDLNLENLRSDVARLTVSSKELESELAHINSNYEVTSRLLRDKEDEVARLNQILKQHENGDLGNDFDKDEAVSTLERKRGEVKWLRQNLNDIRNVHSVNEDRIRVLQNKIEGVTKYLCENEHESDSGLTSVSRDTDSNANTRDQVFVIKEHEVKAMKAQICNVDDGSIFTPASPEIKLAKDDNKSDRMDTKLKKQLKHKEKENFYLQSVVRELKVELQNLQSSLKTMSESRSVLQSHLKDPKDTNYPKSKDSSISNPINSAVKPPANMTPKDADDSSDTLTLKSDRSSSLFTYRYPINLRQLSLPDNMSRQFDPQDCEICSLATDVSTFPFSDDECGCRCSDCEETDVSAPSDGEFGLRIASTGYQHQINRSKEARKVSLREATQAIRAKNRRKSPERVRTSNRHSLSPNFMMFTNRQSYDSESLSSSDLPSPNFRHPRKVNKPRYMRERPQMIPPHLSYVPTSPDSINSPSTKASSIRSQFSSDESQGEGKHSSSSGNRSCNSPLECKGHDCKKRRRNVFSLQMATATREKGGKLM